MRAFREHINRVLEVLLATMGFQSCFPLVKYGCPHADTEVDGVVVNDQRQPLSGMQVVVKESHRYVVDTLHTDSEGEFEFEREGAIPFDTLTFVAEDPTHVYRTDSVSVAPKYKGGDKHWDEGSAEEHVTIVMKHK